MPESSAERRAQEAHWTVLMTAAQQGDGPAYRDLLRELLLPLRAFAMSRRVEPSLVDDVVQTVLMSIHRARHTHRPERPFDPWLWTIARNAVTDAHRARSRQLRREVGLDELSPASEPQTEWAAEEPISPALRAALQTPLAIRSGP
jgi:RNA polymerase sigma-70 factor (ECF subfamily)